MTHTTSTIVVACRGARRWFDLDSVRVPWTGGINRPHSNGRNTGADENDSRATLGPHTQSMVDNGAPPLDWHHDAPIPGVIVLGEPPDDERDDPIALAVKIIDCMCPRQVCVVCGVARERIVGDVEYVPTPDRPNALPTSVMSRQETDRTAIERSGGNVPLRRHTTGHSASVARHAETLGWSDCGHDSWRRGRVFDPFGNPAIRAACELLDREYVTVIDTADL